MADRDARRAEAAKHIALMKGAFAAETEATVAAAKIYEDGDAQKLDLGEPAYQATKTRVTTDFPVNALYRAKAKACVVSPTAFSRPGGAYEDGSFGPEQALCASSNLYQALQGKKAEYHDKNRGYASGQLFTSRALYLPDVVFNRGGNILRADVLAIPEPNRARALENNRSERECDECLAGRIESLLDIAAAGGCATLVVGAFGCGRQGYDPQQVIGLFRAWIDAHPGAFETITFAVPRPLFDAFNEAFGAPVIEEQVAEETAAEDDEDDAEGFFDPSKIDLPEGVTFRS